MTVTSTSSLSPAAADAQLLVSNLLLTAGQQLLAPGIDLQIKPGQGLRVIGPNGAGKSTLLNVIAGLSPFAEGEITLSGQPLAKLGPEQISKQVSLLRQIQEFAYPFSVQEVFASHGQELSAEIPVRLRVLELAKKRLPQLSGGELQRVFLSLTLMRETWLTLLDEPLASQDDEMQSLITVLLGDLRASRRSFLIATHGGFEDLPAIELTLP